MTRAPAALVWNAAQARAQRLAGQRLDRPAAAGSLVATCGAIGGAQAQVGSAARLGLAVRVAGLTAAAYERALFDERTLVKTWTVRGTLHVIPSEDLALHVAAFGHRRLAGVANWLGRGGIDERTAARITDDVVAALADGPLTRRGIAARVATAHGPAARKWIEHSWGGLLRRGVHEGRVCFGPQRGTAVTFVRTDHWLPAARAAAPPHSAAEAEQEMVRRYVRAYAPATPRDFAFWAGLYVPEALRMWGRIEAELVPVTVEGRAAWLHEADLAAARRRARTARAPGTPPAVRLLAHFDPYLLGHRDKAPLVEPARYKRVFRTAGWIAPVVLVDGRIAGTWEPGRTRTAFTGRVRGFVRPTPALREAARAALAPLAAFEGLDARLAWR